MSLMDRDRLGIGNRRWRTTGIAIALAVLVGAWAGPAEAVVIYGMSGPGAGNGPVSEGKSNALLQIDSATGEVLGPPLSTGTDGVEALEILPDGTFLFVSWGGSGPFSPNELFRMNPVTGEVNLIGTIQDPNESEFIFVEGLAYGNGKLYGSADNDFDPIGDHSKYLIEIDPSTAEAKLIGAFGDAFQNVEALAFAPDGTLYGADIGTDTTAPSLITIDLLTGQATLVATLPTDTLIAGMDFAPDGTLYASTIPQRTVLPDGTLPSRLATVNILTGEITDIGPIEGLVDGATFQYNLVQGLAVVPEPSSLALLGLGGLGLAWLARSRRGRSGR